MPDTPPVPQHLAPPLLCLRERTYHPHTRARAHRPMSPSTVVIRAQFLYTVRALVRRNASVYFPVVWSRRV